MQEETQKRADAAERGFTLIELLVVILIIGILAAIAIPSFLNQKGKANDAAAKEMAHSAQIAAETYGTDNNGDYTNLTAAALNQYEATIQTSAGNGNAWVLPAGVSGSANGYTVVAVSVSGDQFTITRSGGTITRTCSGGAGGCVNGTW
jgi:type IV pilus assembly protein PilA